MDLSFGPIGFRSIPASYCCTQLAQCLGTKVAFPGVAAYNATQDSYFTTQEADLSPACIVVPTTPQDVAEAVKIMSGIESCHFAIKGQSHTPAAGFANINGGVTLDMTSLKLVTVNANHTVASIGGGASWLEVYSYLDTLGLTVPGGRNGAVGVGGLTLGGGISYWAPRVGWTCDNVVNFEIVLASGELTNVNANSRPDLFRALKGGSNNFGVVTRFDISTIVQGQILAGSVANPISDRDAVFKAFTDIAGAPEYDPYASIVTGLTFTSSNRVWGLGSTPIYTKPILNPPVYKELFAIPTVSNSTMHITNISTYSNETNPPKLNWAFFTGTYGVSSTLLSRMFDEVLNATLYDFNIPENITWSIAFEPFPTVLTQYGDLKGGNSLGTEPKDGNAFIMLLAGIWPDTASDALVEKTAQKIVHDVNGLASSMGLLHRFQYLNYADPSQHPIQSYGPDNVARLQAASKKYDPKGVFQKKVPGGFKLGLYK